MLKYVEQPVQMQANKKADLDAKKAADLAAATVHLFTNNINPVATNVVGDFTEPTLTGYAAVAVAGWDTDESLPDGSVGVNATNLPTFVGPGDATGQQIFGYFVLSAGAGTPIIEAARFDAPVSLMSPADVLNIVVRYKRP